MISLSPLEVVFWTCAGLVVFAYFAYPLLIWVLARTFGRPNAVPVGGAERPSACPSSLQRATRNSTSGHVLRICCCSTTRADRIEIVIASDGEHRSN